MGNRLSLDYFHPGQMIMLERWIGKIQTKGLSKIIGAREPFYLLVDMPFVNNRALFNPGDKQCTVRFLSEGAVIGFRARVEKILMEPFPILVLIYPEEFEEIIVRQTDRVGCNIPASLMPHPPASESMENKPKSAAPAEKRLLEETDLPQPDEPLLAAIIDLSVGGCQIGLPCIEADSPPEDLPESITAKIPRVRYPDYHPLVLKSLCAQGRTLGLDFALPNENGDARQTIECGVCWSKVFRNYYLLGLRFLNLPDETAERLRKTIEIQRTFFTQPFEPV